MNLIKRTEWEQGMWKIDQRLLEIKRQDRICKIIGIVSLVIVVVVLVGVVYFNWG